MHLWELQREINDFLDHYVKPEIKIGGHTRPTYSVTTLAGLPTAAFIIILLVFQQSRSLTVGIIMVLTGMVLFFAVTILIVIVTGQERYEYLNFKFAIPPAVVLVLSALNEPILPYLDIFMVGVATLLGFMKTGCLMAGCCHGRPAPWGVMYGQDHIRVGFTDDLAFIRLIPIQGMEALIAFTLALSGGLIIILGLPAGTFTSWYVIIYAVQRLFNEFIRGDDVHLYLAGFSRAQWACLVLILLITVLEIAQILPFSVFNLILGILTISFLVYRWLKYHGVNPLLRPHHIREIARIVHRFNTPFSNADEIKVDTTSLGISLSHSIEHVTSGQIIHHITLSRHGSTLSLHDIEQLADLIALLRGVPTGYQILTTSQHSYHIRLIDL